MNEQSLSHHSIPTMILLPLILAALSSVQASTAFPSRVLVQSPVLLENIAVRTSSELLVTSFSSPTLFTFDPKTRNGTLNPVHTFPNATAITGIAEYHPGVFALAASITKTTTFRMTAVVVWSIDLNSHSPAAREICALPGTEGANAITALPGHPDTVLLADSVAGGVWQINTRTDSAHLAILDVSMSPGAPAPALGINGLHIRDAAPTTLYFSNSELETLARVKLRVQGGNVTTAGPAETLASVQSSSTVQNPDDFALDRQGRVWMTVHPGAVTLLSPPVTPGQNWTQLTAVGDAEGSDAELIQPTSAAFGRGSAKEEQTLYAVTGAGQIVAVNTK
ncbi:hypothetical protein DFH06DRAFT_1445332 [Mycena polygramma]|nr:hypothetical protein DFH06DRAFT_1445332 [Mycena polygramma]